MLINQLEKSHAGSLRLDTDAGYHDYNDDNAGDDGEENDIPLPTPVRYVRYADMYCLTFGC